MLFPCMVLGSPAARHLVLLKACLQMHNFAIGPSTNLHRYTRLGGAPQCCRFLSTMIYSSGLFLEHSRGLKSILVASGHGCQAAAAACQ